ncbi:hypothetical protein VH567_01050 [Sphingomonas sp. 4RDLI-65]|uniref:hypothetical protein n=1 Tax=Sphingomonas sp. 4RDLI-65 TaxID=3111641 RepID=UPI003C298D0C
MTALRRLLAHRSLAILVCLAALAMKLLVPSGYMIASDHGRLAITLCPGVSSQAIAMPMAMATPMTMSMHADMADHAMPQDHGSSKEHGKTEMPCAFSSLSAQALGAVDPILLVLAIAFVMALGLRAIRPLPTSLPRYLRPPLRGPPALIR